VRSLGRELCRRLILPLLLATACRHFDVCGDGVTACHGENVAVAGAAGESASAECGARYRSCDGTPLNGCETDTEREARHCGACDNHCSGVCANSRCVPFSVLAPGWQLQAGRVLATSEFVYFAASRRISDRALLQRLTRWDNALVTLAEGGFRSADVLAVSPSRLYLVDSFSLLSFPIQGGSFVQEDVSAQDVVAAGSRTAVASTDGTVLVREDDSATWRSLPGMVNAVHVTGTRSRLVVAEVEHAEENDFVPTYTLSEYEFPPGEPRKLTSGVGFVSGLNADASDSRATLYFSLKTDQSASDAVLFALEPDAEPKAVAELVGANHWVIVDDLESPFFGEHGVVSDYQRGWERGLRFTALGRSFTREWLMARPPEVLGIHGSELFFIDAAMEALVRVNINAMIAPLTGTGE
jgi:hypothetical protein